MTTRRNPWAGIKAQLKMWRETALHWNKEALRLSRLAHQAEREARTLRAELETVKAVLERLGVPSNGNTSMGATFGSRTEPRFRNPVAVRRDH